MDLHLKDHSAVIVGGASGIGLASAECFAAEGVKVAIWDNAANTEQVAEAISIQFQVRSVGVSVDVTDAQSIMEAIPKTTESLGPINHLVHGAAIRTLPT